MEPNLSPTLRAGGPRSNFRTRHVTSNVTAVKIDAKWDGRTEHAADVSIKYIIEAQPGTCIGLLTTNNSAIGWPIHSTIQQHINSKSAVAEDSADDAECSEELTGDTLTGSEVESRSSPSQDEELQSSDQPASPKEDVWPVRNPKRTKSGQMVQSEESCGSSSYQENLDTPTHKPSRAMTLPRPLLPRSRDSTQRPLIRRSSSTSAVRATPTYTLSAGHSKLSSSLSRYYGSRPSFVTPVSSNLAKTSPTEACQASSKRSTSVSKSFEDTPLRLALSSPSESPKLWVQLSPTISSPLRFLLSSRNELPIRPEDAFPMPVSLPRVRMIQIARSSRQCVWSSSEGYSPVQVTRSCSAQLVSPTQGINPFRQHEPTSYAVPQIETTISASPEETRPNTILSEDVLYVCFPEHTTKGVYEVRLQLCVLLQPDGLGWQKLRIPSLHTNPNGALTGFLDFLLDTPEDGDRSNAQFDTSSLFSVEDDHAGRLKARFDMVDGEVSVRIRFKAAVYNLESWNSSVLTYSTISCGPELGMTIQHSVSLNVQTKCNYYAEKVSFSILMRNGLLTGGTYRLEAGQCVLQLVQPAVSSSARSIRRRSHSKRSAVEIIIERHVSDMDKQLSLEFTLYYPEDNIAPLAVALPVITPKHGKTLVEKAWVLRPLPPIEIHGVPKLLLSTWNVTKQTITKRELLCFHRIELSMAYPEAFAEDAVIHIYKLRPTRFTRLLASENTGMSNGVTNSLPSLDMVIDILPTGLECRMYFALEVGHEDRLVQIEALGWQPKYALVNGHLSTDDRMPWYEDDGCMNLFPSSWTKLGETLQVEMAFVVDGHELDQSTTDRGGRLQLLHPLPRITDKSILGGELICHYDGAAIAVQCNEGGKNRYGKIRFFNNAYGKDRGRLPMLPQGYTMHLRYWFTKPAKPVQRKASNSVAKDPRIQRPGRLPVLPKVVHFDDEVIDILNIIDSSGSESSIDEDGSRSLDDGSFRADAMKPKAGEAGEGGRFVDGMVLNDDNDANLSEEHDLGDDDQYIPGTEDERGAPSSANLRIDHVDRSRWSIFILRSLVGAAAWTVRRLERTSPMHFFVRFLMLECIICLAMPWAYFGGHPARGAREVLSGATLHARGVLLGELLEVHDAAGEVLCEVRGAVWEGEAGDRGNGDGDDEGEGAVDVGQGMGWRDRIDLALGWRPVVG